MERDETAAAGLERGLGHHVDGEDEAPLVLGNDGGVEGKDAVGGVDAGVVAHPKSAAAFLDLQIRDRRLIGLPARASDHESKAAQGLDDAEADVAELPAFELGRERAGPQEPRLRRRMLGAVKPERFRWRCRHLPLPRPAQPRLVIPASAAAFPRQWRKGLPGTGMNAEVGDCAKRAQSADAVLRG